MRIPRGSRAEVGWKDHQAYHKDFTAELKWKAPEIHVNNTKVYTSISVGLRVTLALSLPGAEHLGPFHLEERWDLPKLEVAAGQANSNQLPSPIDNLRFYQEAS